MISLSKLTREDAPFAAHRVDGVALSTTRRSKPGFRNCEKETPDGEVLNLSSRFAKPRTAQLVRALGF
jgi:hypothetical protein